MILNSIHFTNLRSFKEAKTSFAKINHITGRNHDQADNNGTGKSTLLLSSLLLLGGAKFANINLKKFIRDGEKSAMISGVIESKGDVLEIERVLKKTGTASLTVKVNGKDPNYKTAGDYQNLIFEYIGDVDNFKKFRLLDSSTGINILDFTSGQLRKTLMALCQNKFDVIRQKLLDKKNKFEKFNKDAVLHKHAPSEKRLALLTAAIQELEIDSLKQIMEKLSKFQREKNNLLTKKGKISQDREIKNRQRLKMTSMAQCPTCLQKVSSEYKAPIIQDLNEKIKACQQQIVNITKELNIYSDIISTEENKKAKLYSEKQKLNGLKYKLQTRISQKDYCYTKEDIELAKKAIEVIDEFANYYICEWINVIEPLVNSYIAKLNMQMKFNATDKGKLEVSVLRSGKSFTYDQLSQGEKTFISVIFKIALLLERQENGCIFCDESFDCLSIENLNRLIDVISELPIQLIFVSHKEDYHNLNAKTIFIEKKKGISKLKEK